METSWAAVFQISGVTSLLSEPFHTRQIASDAVILADDVFVAVDGGDSFAATCFISLADQAGKTVALKLDNSLAVELFPVLKNWKPVLIAVHLDRHA